MQLAMAQSFVNLSSNPFKLLLIMSEPEPVKTRFVADSDGPLNAAPVMP